MLKKILHISPVIIILNLSVLLLVYFGYKEAQRTYWKFKLDKLISQSQIVCDLMDDFLQIGLPLSLIKDFLEKESSLGKFAGFSVFLENEGHTYQNDITITVMNHDGDIVFSNDLGRDKETSKIQIGLRESSDRKDKLNYRHAVIRSSQYLIRESDACYQMVLPLHDKFSQVGHLVVTISKKPVQQFLNSRFTVVFYVTGGICLFLVIFIVLIDQPWAERHYKTYMGMGYTLASLITASVIVATLISIYSYGAEDKVKMLSKSLTKRLSAIVESGVEFHSVYGLDTIVSNYQQLDKDIHTVALTDNRIVLMHPNSEAVGHSWRVPPGQKEYAYKIGNSDVAVVVTMDKSIIHHKVLLAVKNLATLIVACFFIGFLTFNIGTILRRIPKKEFGDISGKKNCFSSQCLYQTMMPVWFLIVFAESLNLSFLPAYLNDICNKVQTSSFYSSILFSAFFIGFALILIPSGYFSDKTSDKQLIMYGIIAFAVSMVLMGITQNDLFVLIIRFMSGAAQGVVFIGVQNYIRKISEQGRVTQGGSVIVFSFNGGIISGSAIGSILLADVGIQGIFFSAAVISIAAFCFTLIYVPELSMLKIKVPIEKKTAPIKRFLSKVRTLITDGEFIRTLFLVGAASKAIYTGITIYAVPLLMIRFHYTQEDIGLALMLYAGAVLLSNYYISKWVDKSGNITIALCGGVMVSSFGIMAIGLVEWESISKWLSYSITFLFFGGMLLLGIANGAISSPVVSHIMDTNACRTLGPGTGVGAYRLFERMGHVAGPLIIGPLMAWGKGNMNPIILFGMIISVFGLTFLLATDRRQRC